MLLACFLIFGNAKITDICVVLHKIEMAVIKSHLGMCMPEGT